ncbi:response regulator transcription factor [Pedobacter sp. Du54]|uniref:response regulator transcription factor n=1 Tax=Pedobacter anseongensis TaxID=3133439 RepID=UPI0030AFEC08
MNIKVAIADDQKLFRRGMAALISSFDEMEIIFEAENGRELLDLCTSESVKPDVIVLDLSMPVLNGLETLKILKEDFPAIRVIILTIHEAENFVLSTIQAGANGYLAKNAEPEEVELAIREVYKNDFHFTIEMLELMRTGLVKKTQNALLAQENKLTRRETEILILICKQLSSGEIAEKMFLSNRTVEGHRNNLLLKTGSRNTAGLVVYALKHKIIDLSSFTQ